MLSASSWRNTPPHHSRRYESFFRHLGALQKLPGGIGRAKSRYHTYIQQTRRGKKYDKDLKIDPLIHEGYKLFKNLDTQRLKVIRDIPEHSITRICGTWFHDQPQISYNGKKISVDGCSRRMKLHKTTTTTSKKDPHGIFDDTNMEGVHHTRITPAMGDAIRVDFPQKAGQSEQSSVHIFFCRADSTDSSLKDLYFAAKERVDGHSLDDLIDGFVAKNGSSWWEDDHKAGGHYLPFGFGMLGSLANCPIDRKDPVTGKDMAIPQSLRTMQFPESEEIVARVGKIFRCIATVAAKYCPSLLVENHMLKDQHRLVMCPPISKQDPLLHWIATQFVFRRLSLRNLLAIVAGHTDSGDVPTAQPLVYMPGGGPDGEGGKIPDEDIVICEHKTGGHSVRINTNNRGTVAVIFFNSRNQLHGVVRSSPDGCDETAFCTRIVPYIQARILTWMKKNPSGTPWIRYPGHVQLMAEDIKELGLDDKSVLSHCRPAAK